MSNRNPIELLTKMVTDKDRSFYWKLSDGKVHCSRVLERKQIWLYPHRNAIKDQARKCYDCQFLFYHLHCLPFSALDCWKVVIPLKRAQDLFMLYNFMNKDYGRPRCKLGKEVRPFVKSRNYGGYYYHNTKEDGLETKNSLSKELEQHFGRKMELYLKRGCTEYEMDIGPSDKWDEIMTDEELGFQKLVLSYCDFTSDEADPPLPPDDYQTQMIIDGWFDWAKKVEVDYVKY